MSRLSRMQRLPRWLAADRNHRLRHRRSVLHLPLHPQSPPHARAGEPFLARADASSSPPRAARRCAWPRSTASTGASRRRSRSQSLPAHVSERVSGRRGRPLPSPHRHRSDRHGARALHQPARARHRRRAARRSISRSSRRASSRRSGRGAARSPRSSWPCCSTRACRRTRSSRSTSTTSTSDTTAASRCSASTKRRGSTSTSVPSRVARRRSGACSPA